MVANVVIAQLLFLQKENKTQDINIYINSPGGSVTAGLAIYDTIQFVQCPSRRTASVRPASMGALLSRGGQHGKRLALPNTAYHDPSALGRVQGTAADISIHADEIAKLKKTLNTILGKHTGKTPEQIEKTPTGTSSWPLRTPRTTAWSTRSSESLSRKPILEPEAAVRALRSASRDAG
jgi:ATP-dependent Clp protease protease subunit